MVIRFPRTYCFCSGIIVFPVELTKLFGAHKAVLGFDALRKMFGMLGMNDSYFIRLI